MNVDTLLRSLKVLNSTRCNFSKSKTLTAGYSKHYSPSEQFFVDSCLSSNGFASTAPAGATFHHRTGVDLVAPRSGLRPTLPSGLVEVRLVVNSGATVLGDLVVGAPGAVEVVRADLRSAW